MLHNYRILKCHFSAIFYFAFFEKISVFFSKMRIPVFSSIFEETQNKMIAEKWHLRILYRVDNIKTPPVRKNPAENIWRFLENIKNPEETFGEIWKILRARQRNCARSARKFLGLFGRYTGGNRPKTVKNRCSILGFLSWQFWKILKTRMKHSEKFGKY